MSVIYSLLHKYNRFMSVLPFGGNSPFDTLSRSATRLFEVNTTVSLPCAKQSVIIFRPNRQTYKSAWMHLMVPSQ